MSSTLLARSAQLESQARGSCHMENISGSLGHECRDRPGPCTGLTCQCDGMSCSSHASGVLLASSLGTWGWQRWQG